MSAPVLKYTLVVRHPDSDAATALVAGKPLPEWASGLVDPSDLVEVDPETELLVGDVEVNDDMSEREAIARVVLGPGVSQEQVDAGIARLTKFLAELEEYDDGDAGDDGATSLDGSASGVPAVEPPAVTPTTGDGDDDEKAPATPVPAAERPHPNSGQAKWLAYAKGLGLDVSDDAEKAAIVAAVEAHEPPQNDN